MRFIRSTASSPVPTSDEIIDTLTKLTYDPEGMNYVAYF